jgi:putative aldouronate transport system substrate-binding protein
MKKTRQTRLLALLCVCCLLLGMLSACGSSTSNTEAEETVTEETAAPSEEPVEETVEVSEEVPVSEEPAAEEPAPEEEPEPVVEDTWTWPVEDPDATLTVWYAYPPFFPNYYDTAADFPDFAYCQQQTGVKLEFQECTFMTAQENLTLLIASEEYPELIFNMSDYVTTNLEYAVNEDIVQDLADYIPQYMPNYSNVFYSNDEYVKRATTDAGYIPAIYELNDLDANEGINKSGPVVRKDWLEACGLDVPQTYDDYYEVLKAFQTYCEHPLWMPYTGAYTAGVFAAGFGVTAEVSSARAFLDVDGTVVFSPLEDGYKEYLQLMNQWYTEGLIDPDFTSYTQNASAPTNDQIAAEEIGIWSAAANLMDYSNLGNENVVVTAATNPVQNAGDTTMFGDKTAALGTEVVVTTNCDQLELALRWCDWWYTDDGYYTANYGIENESFTFDDEGNARYTDLILNPSDGMTVNIAQSLYTCGNGMLLCVQDATRAYQWYGEDQIAAEKLWATVDKATCLMPSISMTSEESDTFSSRYSDIQTYLEQMIPSFIIGAVSFDQWDEFIDNIQRMGIDECIAVEQAALDRYYER